MEILVRAGLFHQVKSVYADGFLAQDFWRNLCKLSCHTLVYQTLKVILRVHYWNLIYFKATTVKSGQHFDVQILYRVLFKRKRVVGAKKITHSGIYKTTGRRCLSQAAYIWTLL